MTGDKNKYPTSTINTTGSKSIYDLPDPIIGKDPMTVRLIERIETLEKHVLDLMAWKIEMENIRIPLGPWESGQ